MILRTKIKYNLVGHMTNYCNEWKRYVSFKEIKYEDFISTIAPIITDAECLQKVDGILGALIYERDNFCKLQTTSGQYIEDIPIVNEYKNILDNIKGINQIVLMGELVGKKIWIYTSF